MQRLPPDQLLPRHLYLGRGRNFDIGVWDGSKGFIGARFKFGWMLDTEYHYDLDPHYGTFSPYYALEAVPVDLDLTPRFTRTGAEMKAKYPDREYPYPNYSEENGQLMEYIQDAKVRYEDKRKAMMAERLKEIKDNARKYIDDDL